MTRARRYFPVFLQVGGAKALVAGGGAVALRKCRDLLAAGAHVWAVAPSFCPELKRLSSVRRLARRFRATDIRGAAVVIAATDSARVNERVAAAARRAGVPVNVVDNPELSTFIVPAVLRRGPVVVAISTGGASPALARNLRDRIGRVVDAGAGRHAAFLARVRGRILAKVTDASSRKRILERLAEDDVRKWIATGDARRANALMRRLIAEAERQDSPQRARRTRRMAKEGMQSTEH